MLILKSSASERSVDSASHPRAGFLPQALRPFTFIAHQGFYTQILAYMLDSLVRVSRRVAENHLVNIANPASGTSTAVAIFCTDRTLFSHALGQPGSRCRPPKRAGFRYPPSNQMYEQSKLNQTEVRHQLQPILQKIERMSTLI